MPDDTQQNFLDDYNNLGIKTNATIPFDQSPAGNNAGIKSVIGSTDSQTTETPVSASGRLQSSQNIGYNTGTGWWIGIDNDGIPKFFLGKDTGNKITWDGTTLSITGNITATTGTIGGWIIGATTLTGGTVVLDSSGTIQTSSGVERIVMNGPTNQFQYYFGNVLRMSTGSGGLGFYNASGLLGGLINGSPSGVISIISNGGGTVIDNVNTDTVNNRFEPNVDAVTDLGAAIYRFKDLYLSGNLIGPQLGNNLFGNGANGDAVITGTTTLSQDTYYNNLTVNSGGILDPGGYQIFVKGTLTIASGGHIKRDGNTGSVGSNGIGQTGGGGGAGGVAVTGVTVPSSIAGTVGGNGGQGGANGGGNPGQGGQAPTNSAVSIGSAGVSMTSQHGGQGGAGGGYGGINGGTGSAGGTSTPANNLPNSFNGATVHADVLSTYNQHTLSASSGGSGGGSGGSSGAPGWGGGGGGGGGS